MGNSNNAFMMSVLMEFCIYFQVRGFTLNYKNSQVINYQSVKDLILKKNDPNKPKLKVVNPSKICRDSRSSTLYNRPEVKEYDLVYTKRIVLPDLDTMPYGTKY